jgi:hypothetical protein
VPELWFPVSLFRVLELGLPSAGALHALDTVWKVSLALACMGLFTRAASFVAFALGFYLLGVPHNFGKIHHSDAQLMFILAALALSRAGDHFSLDAWLARRRGRPPAPARSGEYRWPIRLAWLSWILVYFSAGLNKLREAGLSWVSAGDMSNRLLLNQATHAPPTDWGVWVAAQPALCLFVACLAFGTELSSPLALVNARARAVFIPTLGLMQLGIWLLMGVKFGSFVAAYIFWIPWRALAERARIRTPG